MSMYVVHVIFVILFSTCTSDKNEASKPPPLVADPEHAVLGKCAGTCTVSTLRYRMFCIKDYHRTSMKKTDKDDEC